MNGCRRLWPESCVVQTPDSAAEPTGALGYMLKLAQRVDAFPGGVQSHRESVCDRVLAALSGDLPGPAGDRRTPRSRPAIAVAALNSGLARTAAPYFILPFVVGAAITAIGLWRNTKAANPKDSNNGNPLQFWTSLQMAAVFQVMLYVVHGLTGLWGNKGLLVSGAVVGFTDVDALAVSMARGEPGSTVEMAASALAVGIVSNTVLKLGVVLALGTGRFRWLAAGGLLLIALALAASIAFYFPK